MSTRKQHLRKAKHNKDFCDSLTDCYTDWKIISLFYSALHIIDAHAETENKQFQGHEARFDFIRKRMKSVYFEYQTLYDYSEEARYRDWTNCLGLKNRLDNELVQYYVKIKQKANCNF